MQDSSAGLAGVASVHALAGIESGAPLAGIHVVADRDDGLLDRLCGGFAAYRLAAADRQLQAVVRSALDAGNVFRDSTSRDDFDGQVLKAATFNRLVLAWIEFEDRLRTALPLPGAAAKAAETVVALIDPAVDATGPVVSNIIRRAADLDGEIARIRADRGLDTGIGPDQVQPADMRARVPAPA